MKALAGVNLSRMSTPRNWTLPWVARATLASSGASAVHGPHHEAHTFTTTGFPWSWATSQRNAARSKVGSWSGRDGRSRPFASAGVSEFPPVHPDATSERTIPRARMVTAERRGGMSPSIVPAISRSGERRGGDATLPSMAGSLDAATLRRSMDLFAEALRRHREEIDSLNVFPVPDGDTGTNMLLTQEAVVSELASLDGRTDLRTLGEAISRASLMGARGNSGVILSQVLRGLSERIPDDGSVGPKALAGAIGHASREADRAVAMPQEGTVLSVLRDAAEAAAE